MDGKPLLVTGRYEKGRTIAYLGFSPEGSPTTKDQKPVLLDRALRSSTEARLFATITATILALAANQEPLVPIGQLLEGRATPLFETLKNAPWTAWPEVSLSWGQSGGGVSRARIRIRNGPHYVSGFRLRLEGPDFQSGRALALWSDQYSDLLPGQESELAVELHNAGGKRLAMLQLEAEARNTRETKTYQISLPGR